MKIEQANAIAMPDFLRKMQIFPVSQDTPYAYYRSPLCSDGTVTFIVDTVANTWHCKATDKSGKLTDFVREYLKFHKVEYAELDILRYISIMSGTHSRIMPIAVTDDVQVNTILKVEHEEPIGHPGLFFMLTERKIDLHIGMKYLKELTVLDQPNKTRITCLGAQNDNGDYTALIDDKLVHIGKPDVRFVRGTKELQTRVHIFRNDYDFLAVLTAERLQAFKDDVIILNSYTCLETVTPYLCDYGYRTVSTWFSNDETGTSATRSVADYLSTQPGMTLKTANHIYSKYLSVSQWQMFRS